MHGLIERFQFEFGEIYDEKQTLRTSSLLRMLSERAHLSSVPRMAFHEIAVHRKRTKTPPGFKDEGDGDFFAWIEFLQGLIEAKRNGIVFSRAVFVTNDEKPDWSRVGVAHPLLAAEVHAAVNVPFEVWNLQALIAAVVKEVDAKSASASTAAAAALVTEAIVQTAPAEVNRASHVNDQVG